MRYVLALLLVSACSIHVTPVTTTIDIDQRLEQLEADYLDYLHDWSADQLYVTAVDVLSDDELVTVAYTTCLALDEGMSVEEMAEDVVAQGVEDEWIESMAAVLGAAVATFCPWVR